MEQKRPIGIKIFAIIGILYGIFLLLFSSIFFLFPMMRHFFIDLLKTQPHRLYITLSIYSILALSFIISGQMLLKKRIWGRNLFLLSVTLNLVLGIYDLARGIVNNIDLNVQLVNLGSIIEFLFVFTLSIIIFWYFNCKNTQDYFESNKSVDSSS